MHWTDWAERRRVHAASGAGSEARLGRAQWAPVCLLQGTPEAGQRVLRVAAAAAPLGARCTPRRGAAHRGRLPTCSTSRVPSTLCWRSAWRCSDSSWRCRVASWRRAARSPSRSTPASPCTSCAWSASVSRPSPASGPCCGCCWAAPAVARGAAAEAAAEVLGAAAAERAEATDADAAGLGVSALAPPRRLRLRAAELLAGAVCSALSASDPAASAALSAARRSAASCSVCRSGEGEPAGGAGADEPSSAGERMPLGVVWRLVGVEASGVLMAPSSLAMLS